MPANLEAIARALRRRYGDFDHFNKKNPLDELIFIICSVQTAEVSYKRTFRALREEFRTFEHLNEAPASYLARPLKPGGLSEQKSRSLRIIFDSITDSFGRLTLSPLKDYSDIDCEAFLTKLPSGEVTFGLGDFTLYELGIEGGRFVSGFAGAHTLNPRILAELAAQST